MFDPEQTPGSLSGAKIITQDLLELLTLASRSIRRESDTDTKMLVRDAVNKLDEVARVMGYEVRPRKTLAQIRSDQEAAHVAG